MAACALPAGATEYPDWLAECRIYGLPVAGVKVDPEWLNGELDLAISMGADVIEADSRLSDYLTDEQYETEMTRISETNRIIHERGLKVVWYFPAIEVITPYGRKRDTGRFQPSSMFRKHPDWVQRSFEGGQYSVFYGQKVFWVDKNDESAWMCPNSPFRDWFMERLKKLAATNTDGIWLDVPLMGLSESKWGCADRYCRQKFKRQTGLDFPTSFDISDKTFWRYLQWRHETLREFLGDCANAAAEANPNTQTIVEVVTLDHLGCLTFGLDGSFLDNVFIVWEADGASEHTAMADASYEDWISQYAIYKYCRGATRERPSWLFSYGFNEPDAQLVMAACVAAQNNPYESRTPRMTNAVSNKFRGIMYNWIQNYAEQIFRSESLAEVAVLYSPKNRDFLDSIFYGGVIIEERPPKRNRGWLGRKGESPKSMEYTGDYRGLSNILYCNQIPTDIYPINRVDEELLAKYKVIVVPHMARMSTSELEMLLNAAAKGASLIITGKEAGEWDDNGKHLKKSFWRQKFSNAKGEKFSARHGDGEVHVWQKTIGREYLNSHDEGISRQILKWVQESNVDRWTEKVDRIVVQPYIHENQVILHVLNYSWVGKITNQPNRRQVTLTVPWQFDRQIKSVIQTEPGWETPKTLAFNQSSGNLKIPVDVGINCMVLIDLE